MRARIIKLRNYFLLKIIRNLNKQRRNERVLRLRNKGLEAVRRLLNKDESKPEIKILRNKSVQSFHSNSKLGKRFETSTNFRLNTKASFMSSKRFGATVISKKTYVHPVKALLSEYKNIQYVIPGFEMIPD